MPHLFPRLAFSSPGPTPAPVPVSSPTSHPPAPRPEPVLPPASPPTAAAAGTTDAAARDLGDYGLARPPGLPDDSHLVFRVMPMPSDANPNGDIFGGWIMAQVDLAGAVLPFRIARGRVATVAVNQFLFKQAVSVGDLLSFYARVERIGTTSITLNMQVWAERNPRRPELVKVTEATITYVAIDDQGRSRPIPREPLPWPVVRD